MKKIKHFFLTAAFVIVLTLVFAGCQDDNQEDQKFKGFKFLKEDTGLASDMVGVINRNEKTITFTTQSWINNIERLPAVFSLDYADMAYVNEVPQVSGVTRNDFRNEVVYRFNDDVTYRVRIVSPQSSGLPVIRIDTVNQAPIADRENWVTMTFSLTDINNPSYDIAPISNQQIRGRGNSSWTMEPPEGKKPYRIRFRNNQQQSPFGLAAARNWVLLKEAPDINTPVGFELGKRLGLQYTCTYNYVQLFLNGNYRGTYLFTEHRQADPSERGVPGRPKADLIDGWFVEIDRYFGDDPKFRTTNFQLPVMIKSPDAGENISSAAYDIVRNDWNELADLMACTSFPENGYRDLVDIDTFVKYFIVQTVVMNNDLFRSRAEFGQEIGSTFFYKDRGGLISAGPLWDLSWTFSPWGFTDHTGAFREFPPDRFPYQIHNWFRRFHQDPVFHARYKEIWNNNYQSNIRTMSSFIDNIAAKIEKGALEDAKRWRSSNLGHFGWHVGHVKDYFNTRITYLHREYNKVDVLPFDTEFPQQTPRVHNFGSAGSASAQTFYLVSFGEMTNLSATLQKGTADSPFEITQQLSQTATGEGGFYATISVRPKTSLSAGVQTDVLVLSGTNQDRSFSYNITLSAN